MERSSIDALMIWLVNYLANSAWQVPLVLLVAMVAARLVARLYSAAAVHWTWVSALTLATVLPAFRMEVWPSFPWWRGTTVAGGHVQVTMMPGTAAVGGPLRLSFTLMVIVLAVYGAVTLYFAGRIVWGVWKTGWLRRNASAMQWSGLLQVRWDELRQRLGVMRVELCESTAVAGPAMVGMRTVLLPVGFIGNVQAGDLQVALAHELAHVRRRDYVKNAAYAVLMLPIAYHPCAWLIKKQVGQSRETVCDAMAAEVLEGRRSYARSLLRLAMAIPEGLRGGATAAVGIFEGNTLERRVRTMMERSKQLKGVTRVAVMVAVVAMSGTAIVSMVGTHVTVQAAETIAGKPGPMQVPSHVMALRIVSQVDPIYPKHARAAHDTLNGTCILGLKINDEGVPTNVHVVKRLRKDYDESALTAVRQWRWKPYKVDGKSVNVETQVEITYQIY
jgi:TonB family protein